MRVHSTPFVETRKVPASPTATNVPPPNATPLNPFVLPETCNDQEVPSGEVKMVPSPPTATNSPPPKTTPKRSLLTGDCLFHTRESSVVRITPPFPTAT